MPAPRDASHDLQAATARPASSDGLAATEVLRPPKRVHTRHTRRRRMRARLCARAVTSAWSGIRTPAPSATSAWSGNAHLPPTPQAPGPASAHLPPAPQAPAPQAPGPASAHLPPAPQPPGPATHTCPQRHKRLVQHAAHSARDLLHVCEALCACRHLRQHAGRHGHAALLWTLHRDVRNRRQQLAPQTLLACREAAVVVAGDDRQAGHQPVHQLCHGRVRGKVRQLAQLRKVDGRVLAVRVAEQRRDHKRRGAMPGPVPHERDGRQHAAARGAAA
eukprot:365238-Chlamydomonas_euryale.AAC.2